MVVVVALLAGAPAANAVTITALGFEVQNLDGSGNNVANPTWGAAGQPYLRIAPTRYADGRSQPVAGPNTRMISNRIFNDTFRNVFSGRQASQWSWLWGQFLDHTFGLRDGAGAAANIPFNSGDPLETFRNDLGFIPFNRSAATSGTGVTNARQQTNTESSYIDAASVYGNDASRLQWLRNGAIGNNDASLMLPGGFLPRRDARGDASTAPTGDVDGRLAANPARSFVAGDKRVNENIALSAVHTLFAREHNRIVAQLAATHPELSQEDRFQIARRVVSAEIQFITYTNWLPDLGVPIPAYTGYKPNVNATLGNEFATASYRAHSMIHGEMEFEADNGTWSQATLDSFRAQGVEVAVGTAETEITVPLNVAFFNPDLMQQIGLDPILAGFANESQYKNDEMIDNSMRSVLFQVPATSGATCPGDSDPACFHGVVDLGAIDVERARDHGLATYNQLRAALGLPARTSFTQITGEGTDQFPAGSDVNNPNSLNFDVLRDVTGDTVDVADDAAVENSITQAVRHSTVAARLRSIYNNDINSVDAFVGIVAEPPVAGSELGQTQRAAFVQQFTALRDGDRFFYQNDPALPAILSRYGIDYRRSLSQVILGNTSLPGEDVPADVFFTHGDTPVTSCRVNYQITTRWAGHYQVNMTVFNTGSVPTQGRWDLKFSFANGQQIYDLWNGEVAQDTRHVTILNAATNGTIAAGGSRDGIGFNATVPNDAVNVRPTNFTLNSTPCSSTGS